MQEELLNRRQEKFFCNVSAVEKLDDNWMIIRERLSAIAAKNTLRVLSFTTSAMIKK